MRTATDTVLKLAVESPIDHFIALCEETCKSYDNMPPGTPKQRMQMMLQTLHMIGVMRFPHIWNELSPMAQRDKADLQKFFKEVS